MKRNELIEKMAGIVEQFTSYYQDDFYTHDKAMMEEYPTAKFVWQVRESGTQVYQFLTPDDLPKLGEAVPYLFGTASAQHILNGKIECIRDCFLSDKIFFIVDLERNSIKKVSREMAQVEMAEHSRRVLAEINRKHETA